MSDTNTLVMTPFLRNTLLLDGLVTGAAGVAMLAGATLIAPLTDLPATLLASAGGLMVPWCVALVALARRATLPRLWLIDIVAANALWIAASFGILVSGAVEPNLIGYGFVVLQALVVAVFAELQIIAVRRNRTAAA
jgi:hypothetical protein